MRIRIDGANVPIDQQLSGQVSLDEIGGRHDIHLPVALKRGLGKVALTTSCAPEEITLNPRTESTCSVTAAHSEPTPTTVDISSAGADHWSADRRSADHQHGPDSGRHRTGVHHDDVA